jgi:hypothetical protein
MTDEKSKKAAPKLTKLNGFDIVTVSLIFVELIDIVINVGTCGISMTIHHCRAAIYYILF